MSTTALQVGLIGIGGYGRTHFEMLRDLEARGKVRLRAIADPTLNRLPEIRERLKDARIPCYETDAAMRDGEPGLDFVVIASPIPLHDEMVRRWLETDAWIYLEKPPVPTIQQLRELLSLDDRRRVRVGFQMIHMAPLRRLKQWILEGKLGEIRRLSVVAGWPRNHAYYHRSAWAAKLMVGDKPTFDGPATNALSHVIHNIMFLAGADTESFSAPELISGEFYRAREIESYDLATLSGEFASGARFDVGLAHCVDRIVQPQLLVEGTRATAQLDQSSFLLTCSDGSREEADQASVNAAAKLRTYETFLSQVRGESPKIASTLEDCIPYSLATCGGLISSGNIHSIPDAAKHPYGIDEASGINVPGLNAALVRLGETGESLASQKIPWAVSGNRMQSADVQSIDLSRFCSAPREN